jgi:hypothetical protein
LEVGIDWLNVACSKQINSWFCSGTDSYCTSVANNHQEVVPTTTRQQGGIALFAGKEVRQYISKMERDFRGLGRWNSWLIQSDPSHRTRMVVAYQVGQARQKGTQTIYQQHARYMARHKLPGMPQDQFQDDIVTAITKWINNRDRLILFIDRNKHVLMCTQCKPIWPPPEGGYPLHYNGPKSHSVGSKTTDMACALLHAQ